MNQKTKQKDFLQKKTNKRNEEIEIKLWKIEER